ncbi:MAG: GNAT family N-acetyltransferase, partial [Acidimicrobiia bacterium]
MPLVRDASLEDVGRVAEIHVESWRHAYRDLLPSEYLNALSIDSRRNWLERRLTSLEPRGAILVVENSHSVSGFAFLGPFSETEGEIYAIYVAPESWRQGLGRVLLRGAEARLESEESWRGIDSPRSARRAAIVIPSGQPSVASIT